MNSVTSIESPVSSKQAPMNCSMSNRSACEEASLDQAFTSSRQATVEQRDIAPIIASSRVDQSIG